MNPISSNSDLVLQWKSKREALPNSKGPPLYERSERVANGLYGQFVTFLSLDRGPLPECWGDMKAAFCIPCGVPPHFFRDDDSIS